MIKYLDLQKINAKYVPEFDVNDVLESGIYLFGKNTKEFEQKWAQYCGTEYCLSCGNGLDALTLILLGYDFPKGSEIITSSNTYIATILSISNTNNVPVLVEPIPGQYTIDPDEIEKHITEKTKAILVTHLYGYPCAMDRIMDIANRYGLKVIEDAAQAHGTIFHNAKAGALGHAAAFSFYPSKNLGCLGDAGAITTNDRELFERVNSLHNYGSSRKYVFDMIGVNSRMDEIQALFLLKKMQFLDEENATRKLIAKRYINEIQNKNITTPYYDKGCTWHIFPIHCNNRNDLQKYLLEHGIETAIHYPIPPHKQKAYSEWNEKTYPISEQTHDTILSLPCNSLLTNEQINYIINTVNEW